MGGEIVPCGAVKLQFNVAKASFHSLSPNTMLQMFYRKIYANERVSQALSHMKSCAPSNKRLFAWSKFNVTTVANACVAPGGGRNVHHWRDQGWLGPNHVTPYPYFASQLRHFLKDKDVSLLRSKQVRACKVV